MGEKARPPCGDCGVTVAGTYRQCGHGCGHETAYCHHHGGDNRAQQEMAEHHQAVHPEKST